jgi:septum formation topological specificity factor MinE
MTEEQKPVTKDYAVALGQEAMDLMKKFVAVKTGKLILTQVEKDEYNKRIVYINAELQRCKKGGIT